MGRLVEDMAWGKEEGHCKREDRKEEEHCMLEHCMWVAEHCMWEVEHKQVHYMCCKFLDIGLDKEEL